MRNDPIVEYKQQVFFMLAFFFICLFKNNQMPYTFFVIVGPGDALLYSREFPETRVKEEKATSLQLREFVMYAALDPAEESAWGTTKYPLGVIDKYESYYISAYVTPSLLKLMMMQDDVPRDNVQPFFHEVHELVLRYILNPFTDLREKIESKAFDEAVVRIMENHF